MKSWIHEIAESYVSTHKPVRRDLKENYVQLNEEQKFGLLSENVLNYLDEQLQNAYGFGVNDLTEEQLNELLGSIRNVGRAVREKGRKVIDATKGVAKGAALAGALAGGAASGSQHDSMYAPQGAPVVSVTKQGGFNRVGSVTSDGLVGKEDGTLVQRQDGRGNAVAHKVANEDGTPVGSDGLPELYRGGRLPRNAAVQDDDSTTIKTLGAVGDAYGKVARAYNPFGPKVVKQTETMSQTKPSIFYNR